MQLCDSRLGGAISRGWRLKSFWDGRPEFQAVEFKIMKKTIKQACIGWVGNELGKEIFVVVDSSPITSSSCDQAQRVIELGRSVPGFVPAVFLDEELDSSELRSWLQSEAVRRFISAKPCCLPAN